MLLESKQTNKSGGSPVHNNHTPIHNNDTTSPRDMPHPHKNDTHLFTIITLPAPEIWPRGTGSAALLVLLPQHTPSHPPPSISISPPCNACNGGLAVRERRPLPRTRTTPCRVSSASKKKNACICVQLRPARRLTMHAFAFSKAFCICVQQAACSAVPSSGAVFFFLYKRQAFFFYSVVPSGWQSMALVCASGSVTGIRQDFFYFFVRELERQHILQAFSKALECSTVSRVCCQG
jgi:hypothetical protein